jgi:superfamily II DNA or RNA helicase
MLIVVPRLQLVTQAYENFDDYASNQKWTSKENVHMIHEGQEKNSDKPIQISTWQSIYKESPDWFQKFNAVFIDEVHELKADSLKGIMEKMIHCPYRVGLTGTFDDVKANKLVIEGLTGPRKVISTTRKLIDDGDVSDIKINIIKLNYDDNESKFVRNYMKNYQDEVKYITAHEKRNNMICDLAVSRKKNTIVLFTKIEHGKALAELINSKTDRPVYLIYGDIKLEERNKIKRALEKDKDAIAVVSYGTFSTGISINNLYYAIFASSYKSKIKILQSIGRGLRLHEEGKVFVLYDLVDNFARKSYINHSVKHYVQRFRYYTKAKLNYIVKELRI